MFPCTAPQLLRENYKTHLLSTSDVLAKKLIHCALEACLHYRSAYFWCWWLLCWIVMYTRYSFLSYCTIPLLSDSTGKFTVTRSSFLWITLSRNHQVADSWFPHIALCYQPGNMTFFTVRVCGVWGKGLHESGKRLAFFRCVLSGLADRSASSLSLVCWISFSKCCLLRIPPKDLPLVLFLYCYLDAFCPYAVLLNFSHW